LPIVTSSPSVLPAACFCFRRSAIKVENLGIIELQPVGRGSLGELALEAGNLNLELISLALARDHLVVGLTDLADQILAVTALASRNPANPYAYEKQSRHASIHVVSFPDKWSRPRRTEPAGTMPALALLGLFVGKLDLAAIVRALAAQPEFGTRQHTAAALDGHAVLLVRLEVGFGYLNTRGKIRLPFSRMYCSSPAT